MNQDFRIGDMVELRMNDKWRMVVIETLGNDFVRCAWLDTLGHMQAACLPFKALRNYSAESRAEAKNNPAHKEWLIQQGMETE